MSNKRQKVGDTECSAIVRDILGQYLIPDLAAIIVDDYMPVVHWLQTESEDPDIWVRLNCRCSVDCKERSHISVTYKYKAPEQGPFRLRTFTTDCHWVGDLGFGRDYRLGFGHEPRAIDVSMQWKAGEEAEVVLNPIQQHFAGEGIDLLVNTAIGCALYA